MNELDAIQEQMRQLGIDVSANKKVAEEPTAPAYDLENPELTPEELAQFQEPKVPSEPNTGEQMPAYDMEELKIDISPMLHGLPKEELANLILWISKEWESFNSKEEIVNG